MSHFKLKSSTKASDVIPVNKYVSEKTGLTVIIAETEGPLVNGFFCLGMVDNIFFDDITYVPTDHVFSRRVRAHIHPGVPHFTKMIML
jgi:hypothetical protein